MLMPYIVCLAGILFAAFVVGWRSHAALTGRSIGPVLRTAAVASGAHGAVLFALIVTVG